VVNVTAYFVFTWARIYNISGLDINGTGKITYFTPTPCASVTWVCIHLSLLGCVVYQITENGKSTIIAGIGWKLPILAMLNLVYTHVQASSGARGNYKHPFVCALLVSSAVSNIHYTLRKYHTSATLYDKLWIHVPFSIYHGWSTVLLVVAAFQAFGVDVLTRKANWYNESPAFFGLLFLETMSFAYIFKPPEGDVVASATMAGSLFAISYRNQRSNAFVQRVELVLAIISPFHAPKFLWLKT
ncbi:hypothetical protein BDV93DRAFT_452111, partial [Ceratobasidium sp. AG-I]